MHMHECDRFTTTSAFGECPFRRMPGHEEEDEERDQPDEQAVRFPFEALIPARRRRDANLGDNLSQFPVIAHGDPVMRKALERMAAIQTVRGLPSLPDSTKLPPFQLRGPNRREVVATIAMLVIMQSLRALRSTGPSPSFQAVRASERHAARGLSQVGQPGRTGGRGGLHVNAAADLRRLMFGRRKIEELGGPIAGFDSFSETGFP